MRGAVAAVQRAAKRAVRQVSNPQPVPEEDDEERRQEHDPQAGGEEDRGQGCAEDRKEGGKDEIVPTARRPATEISRAMPHTLSGERPLFADDGAPPGPASKPSKGQIGRGRGTDRRAEYPRAAVEFPFDHRVARAYGHIGRRRASRTARAPIGRADRCGACGLFLDGALVDAW